MVEIFVYDVGAVLFHFVDGPADQLGGDHRTGDYVSFVNADRAVFRDIGDLILHRLKKIYFIIILASAGSDEHNAFFRQPPNQIQGAGSQFLGSVLKQSPVQITCH